MGGRALTRAEPAGLVDDAVHASLLPPPVRVLLVEDDEGDAFLVRELLLDAGSDVDLLRARTIAEAHAVLPSGVDCVLLDLGLPDASGLEGLRALLEMTPGIAVLVLTGLDDEHRGTEAVAVGAQDYLVKGNIDGQLLTRAIRYAVERKRADESVRRLYASEARQAENARLERGLLPQPIITDRVSVVARYRPGGGQALIGGDFYDVVECADGSIFALIGDVAGHGPDEAALGVCLRIAWRTLVLAGADPDTILGAMDAVLVSERATEEIFATVAMVRVRPDEHIARIWRAGHPSPLVIEADAVRELPVKADGVALGVLDDVTWESSDWPVARDAVLVLFTDGLVEGFDGPGSGRLGTEGLQRLVEDVRERGLPAASFADTVIDEVRARNGEELTDDLAVVLLSWAEWG